MTLDYVILHPYVHSYIRSTHLGITIIFTCYLVCFVFFHFLWTQQAYFLSIALRKWKTYLVKTQVIKCFIFLFILKTVMNKNVCWPGIFFLYLHLNWWLKFCVGQDILRFFSIHHQQILKTFNIFLSLWKHPNLLNSFAT